MPRYTVIRLRAAALLTGLALVLSGCFMSPGKFTSELAITGPDSFTFRYDGEIFFLTLSKMAMMGAETEEAFTPSHCYDQETFEDRECTADEIAQQRAEWDAGASERATKAKKDAEMMKAIMGGIDPTDPKATEEMVRLLERQKGWNKVVHKGDGLFDVSYSVSGTLGHDFLFPTIEGFPATNPFVQMILRDGGQVRINAPAFVFQSGDNPLGAMMGGMGSLAGLAALGKEADGTTTAEAAPAIPVLDGSFSIRIAPGMRILANNTDEGPEAGTDGGELLRWTISPRTTQAPTALIAAAR